MPLSNLIKLSIYSNQKCIVNRVNPFILQQIHSNSKNKSLLLMHPLNKILTRCFNLNLNLYQFYKSNNHHFFQLKEKFQETSDEKKPKLLMV
jgi:hypothetical protein